MKKIPFLFLFFIAFGCGLADQATPPGSLPGLPSSYNTIGDIKVPDGCKRIPVRPGSFSEWLRTIPLRKDNHVYLYNGSLKRNQSAQFAVLDIPVGKKDLQQCADAVMRLRAEYLFAVKRFDQIKFSDNDGKVYEWKGNDNRKNFGSYLENVFSACGSASLEKQLNPVADINEINPGDVFIKGGFPGHAMLVVDMAINDKGKKFFMLAQSYMPAQDIHIVKNPMNKEGSPWYEVNDANEIITPEWIFYKNQLRQW
jgi:Domain of unknown function (4846)